MVLRDLLGHSSVVVTEAYLRQLSGIASDGRGLSGLAAAQTVGMG